jgi:hypothetical protein
MSWQQLCSDWMVCVLCQVDGHLIATCARVLYMLACTSSTHGSVQCIHGSAHSCALRTVGHSVGLCTLHGR